MVNIIDPVSTRQGTSTPPINMPKCGQEDMKQESVPEWPPTTPEPVGSPFKLWLCNSVGISFQPVLKSENYFKMAMILSESQHSALGRCLSPLFPLPQEVLISCGQMTSTQTWLHLLYPLIYSNTRSTTKVWTLSIPRHKNNLWESGAWAPTATCIAGSEAGANPEVSALGCNADACSCLSQSLSDFKCTTKSQHFCSSVLFTTR